MAESNKKFLDPGEILSEVGLTPGSMVVDLGAGSGHMALAAAKIAGVSGKVYVVDILESALEHTSSHARIKNYHNVQTIRHDLESPSIDKIPSGHADLVILGNILHQLKNHSNIFAESYRLLKTGGKLLVIDWSGTKGPIGPKLSQRIGEPEVQTLAGVGNFKFVGNIDAGAYHYGLIFIK